tara:strand:- start:86 stop:622 length:537 start_codon:yes stop_codon:yes gene_type:complete
MKYYRKTLRNRKQKKGKTVDKKQKGKKTKTFIKPRELNRLFRKYTKKFLQKGGFPFVRSGRGRERAEASRLALERGCPLDHPHSVNIHLYKQAAKEAWNETLGLFDEDPQSHCYNSDGFRKELKDRIQVKFTRLLNNKISNLPVDQANDEARRAERRDEAPAPAPLEAEVPAPDQPET